MKKRIRQEGELIKGKVIAIETFGVFVEFYRGIESMIHISELSQNKINSPQEVFELGDEIWVVCRGKNKTGTAIYSAKEG